MVERGARNKRRSVNARDVDGSRRIHVDKSRRAYEEPRKLSKRRPDPHSRHTNNNNNRKTALLARRDDDYEDSEEHSYSSSEREDPSEMSQPPAQRLYLPKTLGSLSSVMTSDSSDDCNLSTIPSAVSEDLYDERPIVASSFSSVSRAPTRSPSSLGSQTYVTHQEQTVRKLSPKHRQKLNQWYQKRFPKISQSISRNSRQRQDVQTVDDTVDSETATYLSYHSDDDEEDATVYRPGDVLDDDELGNEDYLKTKQTCAVLSIGITGIQLFILMMQLSMCGFASVEMNPMIGPYPDAFSEFGGKNTYLMISMQQWWRLVTPSFLHVGILHLLANGFCQLEAIALFEREWGSFRWLLIYLISSVGCSGMSTLFDPDTIAVGSSGALMGLYAAKLAQITTGICFNVSKDNAIRLDQLSSVLCGLTLVSMLSCFTYIDWSGHFGGLVSGFLSGMVLFSYPIKGCCSWFFWSLFGLAGLGATSAAVVNYLMLTYEPFEELGAVCDYFRSVFPETYECGCMNL